MKHLKRSNGGKPNNTFDAFENKRLLKTPFCCRVFQNNKNTKQRQEKRKKKKKARKNEMEKRKVSARDLKRR